MIDDTSRERGSPWPAGEENTDKLILVTRSIVHVQRPRVRDVGVRFSLVISSVGGWVVGGGDDAIVAAEEEGFEGLKAKYKCQAFRFSPPPYPPPLFLIFPAVLYHLHLCTCFLSRLSSTVSMAAPPPSLNCSGKVSFYEI